MFAPAAVRLQPRGDGVVMRGVEGRRRELDARPRRRPRHAAARPRARVGHVDDEHRHDEEMMRRRGPCFTSERP